MRYDEHNAHDSILYEMAMVKACSKRFLNKRLVRNHVHKEREREAKATQTPNRFDTKHFELYILAACLGRWRLLLNMVIFRVRSSRVLL